MQNMNEERLLELSGGTTSVCAFCAGVGLGALFTGNAILGAGATLCGVGCAFGWW